MYLIVSGGQAIITNNKEPYQRAPLILELQGPETFEAFVELHCSGDELEVLGTEYLNHYSTGWRIEDSPSEKLGYRIVNPKRLYVCSISCNISQGWLIEAWVALKLAIEDGGSEELLEAMDIIRRSWL